MIIDRKVVMISKIYHHGWGKYFFFWDVSVKKMKGLVINKVAVAKYVNKSFQ